jgi:hypothetical protein
LDALYPLRRTPNFYEIHPWSDMRLKIKFDLKQELNIPSLHFFCKKWNNSFYF